MLLCVSALGEIKYLVKYVFNGRDKVIVQLPHETSRREEISNIVDGRYFRALEASLTILRLGHVDRQPLVARMDMHLEGSHAVCYQEGHERDGRRQGKTRNQDNRVV